MSYKQICDLCGKEIVTSDYREFKIKVSNRSTNSGDWGWYRIDAHDKCVEKLFEATNRADGSVQEQMNKGIVRRNGKMVRVGSVHKENT